MVEARDAFERCVINKAAELGSTLVEKNRAYGDSVNKNQAILRALYPDGVKPDQFQDFLFIVRMMDKVARICRGDNTTFNEDAWFDLAGYAVLRMAQNQTEET